ncbi:proteasome assembly chaperone family protein [Candidatus Micrarchaeota archaeon]|nr:proteasome assembly chaperone family protein [Candidatus Micrarchaeota archaeon]MBU1166508.1 proteasome assembly chaperone family protein [Candidatus Micrarchaeota archaeon]MBU1887520.1 proteasome assembly chaperone family protein [Candidatus Micrarchaeota archaeon]
MKETTIIEKVKIKKKLHNAVLLTGLPGIGLIGQVVGRYLVEELKAKKVAWLLSPHFPHQVFMTKKGGMRMVKNTFYHYKGKKNDILFLLGDIQAISSVGQYEVASVVLEYCKKLGIKEILTVGGYSTGTLSDQRDVLAVATSDNLRDRLKKKGVIFGKANGCIVGAAGLLPALSRLYDMEGACIMGETHGSYVDTASAKQIVVLLSKYLSIKVDIKRLDKRAKESQKILKKVQEEVEKSVEAQYAAASTNVSYIR